MHSPCVMELRAHVAPMLEPGEVLSPRVDQRLDDCQLGGGNPDHPSGTCTRVVPDYTRGY